MYDKRDKVIEYIGRCLERKRLGSIERMHDFINSQWYNSFIKEGKFDLLLESYIDALGLSFALVCENLHDWKDYTDKNNQEWNYKLWNRRLMEWKSQPPFPREPKKERIKGYMDELTGLDKVLNGDSPYSLDEGKNKTGIPDADLLKTVKKAHGLPDKAELKHVYGDRQRWIAVVKYDGSQYHYTKSDDGTVFKTTNLKKLKTYAKKYMESV